MNIKEKIFKSFTSHLNLWGRTLQIIRKVIPIWTLIWLILLILQGVLPGTTIYLSKLTIDQLIATKNDWSQFNYSLVLLCLTGFTLILTEVLQFLISWVRTIQSDVLTDYLKNLIHQKSAEVDMDFYDSPTYFDLLEQAKSNSISQPLVLLESLGNILQSTITLFTFSTILFSYGWWIPLILFLGSLPSLFIYIRSERLFHEWSKKTTPLRRWLMYFDSVLTTRFTAGEMRIFNLNSYFRSRYQELSLRLRKEKMVQTRRQLGSKLFASILAMFTALIGVGWIVLKVLYSTASLGDLAVFYQVFSRGQSLMQGLLGGINKAFSTNLYLEHLFEFLDLKPKITTVENPMPFPSKLRKGIEFQNIGFTYPGETNSVLKNFNLFIPAEKVVAIVGVNGAGKSTLIKLLCRFYEPNEGQIKIDDIDIKNFDLKELWRNLALHFQFPYQYCETAAKNIAFGDIDREHDIEGLQKAAEQTGAHNFIDKLSKKYDTLCGKEFDEGVQLSGGQWQRLLLAKAYFRKAQILILDEPTSYMDPWSEAEWFEQLQELIKGEIGFLITHRFTIAMRADIIHVIDGGRIIESGSHDSLLKMNGFYAQSWESQMQVSVKG